MFTSNSPRVTLCMQLFLRVSSYYKHSSHRVCARDFCCSQLFQLLLVLSQRVVVDNKIAELKLKEQQTHRMMVFDYVRNLGNQEHSQVLLITVFVAVLCLCLIIGHLLEENRWVNESITAILTVTSLSLLTNKQVELYVAGF